MKNVLIKNSHLFVIAYALLQLFEIYTERTEQLEAVLQQTPVVQSKIVQQERKLKKIEQFKQNLEDSKQRVEEVVAQIEKTQRQLPTEVNDTVIQDYLKTAAEGLRMKDPRQIPGNEQNNGFYFSKIYEFQASGTFLQSLIFFEQLAKSERILNVLDLSIKHTAKDFQGRYQVVDMTTRIESFRYNPNYKEKSGVEEIERQFSVE